MTLTVCRCGSTPLEQTSSSESPLATPAGGSAPPSMGSAAGLPSGSAGSLCPADLAAAVNSRFSVTSWSYAVGNKWVVNSRDITVRCVTHQ